MEWDGKQGARRISLKKKIQKIAIKEGRENKRFAKGKKKTDKERKKS